MAENKTTKDKIKIDSSKRYRVSVFRSNRSINAQIIDDAEGITVLSGSSLTLKEKKTPSEKAFVMGENLAKEAKSQKINQIKFDRNNYKYHGQVKSLAEGLRAGGLEF